MFCILCMVGILIYGRYFTISQLNFFPGVFQQYLLLFIPFCLSFLLQNYFWKELNFTRQRWFWILLNLAPALFCFRPYLVSVESMMGIFSSIAANDFMVSSLRYSSRAIMLILPLLVLWYAKHRRQMYYYGCRFKVDTKLLLLLSFPVLLIVIWATFQPAFAAIYPKAILSAGLDLHSPLWKWCLFEISYALDFFSIELFFRGFLVMAFVRHVGARAIVPAACFYCCIHFDKPMAEAVSSFFGGLLLGSISYHTRSIWTGFFLHLGMAWMMEFACFYTYHL
jgi:hypothetical protein